MALRIAATADIHVREGDAEHLHALVRGVERDADVLVIVVAQSRDDGNPAIVEGVQEHLGLLGMPERIEDILGDLLDGPSGVHDV